jgi:hypothetical protein
MLDSSLEPRQTISKAARALLAMDADMRRVATPGFIRLVERCVGLLDDPTMPPSGSKEVPEVTCPGQVVVEGVTGTEESRKPDLR